MSGGYHEGGVELVLPILIKVSVVTMASPFYFGLQDYLISSLWKVKEFMT